mgnify:CR=1 FL=1
MEKIKQAWTYCAIDAPEDTHGTLKEQFRRLCDYAEQMEFEAVGSSSDCGGRPLMNRPGFRHFMLVVNRNSLSCSSIQLAQIQAMAESLNVEIWSPQEGRIF